MHIAVAGNIGSGKTTLAGLLAKHYDWDAHYEALDDNPYISDFYDDMQRWSFNLQIYFLHSRFNSIIRAKNNKNTTILDRTIYEDAYIFAPNLHAMGLMSTRDFDTYQALFSSIKTLLAAPDLLIYLRSSIGNIVGQIQKRGREYEDSIRLDYLRRLNERYEAWISTYKEGKLLVIDVDDIDFENDPSHLGSIINKIDAELHGLF
jgi:deoxyadenosine/deoxycytidine kinase